MGMHGNVIKWVGINSSNLVWWKFLSLPQGHLCSIWKTKIIWNAGGIIWKTQFIKKDKVRWGLILSYFRLDWDQSSNEKNFLIFISPCWSLWWLFNILWITSLFLSALQHVHYIKVILCLISPTTCTRHVSLAGNIFCLHAHISFACKHHKNYIFSVFYNYQSKPSR